MSAWNQLEQLLTCAICLDRFRNPKLLPCQHTFCGEPCMEGLVDYARRQIKCPECRAEHRLPYQGVQTFPNNVTLARFLDLHRSITGEEPEPVPSMMERCGICSEKSMVERCAHCEKKVCSECKEAHLEILKKEITRINSQVRRGLNKIGEHLTQTEKNCEKLQQNHLQIREEITEIVRRFIKDLKDKEDKLLQELDEFTQNDLRNTNKLKEDLEVELGNITSNCELIEKHVTENEEEWTDVELVEYKEIFLKTLDFLRNFDPDSGDFVKKIKFQTNTDIDALRRSLIDFGELKTIAPINQISPSNSNTNLNLLGLPQNNLMRSQSDHRLAAQFQQRLRQGETGSRYLDIAQSRFGTDQERDRNERASSPPRRGYGRYGTDRREGEEREGRSRFLRDSSSYVSNWARPGDSEETVTTSHFRSRFMRERERNAGIEADDPHDSDFGSHRSVRFEEPQVVQKCKVFETEELTKGPLSGVIKLTDSPHLLQRLHQNEVRQKQKEEEAKNAPPPQPTQPPVSAPVNYPQRTPARQLSEDEIEKQKKQNQAAAAAAATAAATPTAATTPASKVPSSPTTKVPASPTNKVPSSPTGASSESPSRSLPKRVLTMREERPRFPESPAGPQRESLGSTTVDDEDDDSETSRLTRRKRSEDTDGAARVTRPATTPRSLRSPVGKTFSLSQDSSDVNSDRTLSTFRQQHIGTDKKDARTIVGRQESDEEGSSSEDSEEESVTTGSLSSRNVLSSLSGPANRSDKANDLPTSVSSLLTRSAQVRRQSTDQRNRSDSPHSSFSKSFQDDTTLISRKKDDDVMSYGRRHPLVRGSTLEEEPTSRQEEQSSSWPYNRFLSRSRTSSTLANRDEDDSKFAYKRDVSDRIAAYRGRLAKSKSSHSIGNEDSDEETPTSPSYKSTTKTSRSGYVYRTREQSPEEDQQTVSWAQYLKNKYGSSKSGTSSKPDSKLVLRSRSSHALYGKTSISDSSDEETPTSSVRRGVRDLHAAGASSYGLTYPRSMYMQKKKMMMKIGSRGTEPGCFTWPRCVTVGPDNNLVVADSSNHRVQIFDSTGRFMFEFGSYGSGEGEFDCLAGVAVNRIGQFIVSDRYNHRIQVFDPSGRFLRSFGSEGRADGKFSYPWGVATDSLGFIYVCDKENHRVQVFQSDGTFVGKFGSIGNRHGQLEHPHYIAVTSTNRVVVSDSNNHRIQIFDVNGRTLSTFGSEGSEDGQFKFPRGVAVDDQGFIIIGDSGNNRVQIFNPDGTFLKTFGCWGSNDGEFKGLEGIAVSTTGNIYVCDRENHRVQIF